MIRPILLAAALALPGCAAVRVADTAVDATVFVGTTAGRGAVGAGRLVTRTLTSPTEDYSAGTTICLDEAGDIYAAASVQDGQVVCPAAK